MGDGTKLLLSAFLTAGTIYAILVFAGVVTWGAGGGFGLLYDMGKFMAKVPVWIWVLVALVWVFWVMKK